MKSKMTQKWVTMNTLFHKSKYSAHSNSPSNDLVKKFHEPVTTKTKYKGYYLIIVVFGGVIQLKLIV